MISLLLFSPFVKFLFMNSGFKVLPKGLRCSILSKITARMLTFRDRTTDVTYCADVTLFLHATSGGLSQTAAFYLANFLRFIALNAIWPHFLCTKLCFYPTLCRLNTLNKTKLTRNGKEKSKFSDARVEE